MAGTDKPAAVVQCLGIGTYPAETTTGKPCGTTAKLLVLQSA